MQFSNPDQILANVGISPGSVVVDFGAGSGFYSIAAARLVGSGGRVYAIDIQHALLERLKEAAHSEGLSQLDTVWGDIETYGGTRLRDGTADVVICANILFQLENRRAGIDEAKRLLHPSGRMLVIDWDDSHFGMGPDPSLIITRDEAVELLESQGLVVESDTPAGDHHWGLILRHAHNTV
ncbi:MAG: class I SAM-dependent methyltransferase [Patescibacteria group bacterium]